MKTKQMVVEKDHCPLCRSKLKKIADMSDKSIERMYFVCNACNKVWEWKEIGQEIEITDVNGKLSEIQSSQGIAS